MSDRHCQTAQVNMTCAVELFNMFVFSADNSCSMTQPVEKDFPFCNVSFARSALRRFVDDYEFGEVSVSLFLVQLAVRSFTSVPTMGCGGKTRRTMPNRTITSFHLSRVQELSVRNAVICWIV